MPAQDKFQQYSVSTVAPIQNGQAVTPDDNNDLDFVSRAIYIGTSGNLEVVFPNDLNYTFQNLPVGWHPIRVSRIRATGTTASNIFAGW